MRNNQSNGAHVHTHSQTHTHQSCYTPLSQAMLKDSYSTFEGDEDPGCSMGVVGDAQGSDRQHQEGVERPQTGQQHGEPVSSHSHRITEL